jgi:phosphoribosyl 1,2-cyclic phosphate phosphodiesterase
MSKTPLSRNMSGKMVFLGTGTSVGVPMIGCPCSVCISENPKNHRTRCAVVLGLPQGNLLIDTPPDLRSQLLREQIGIIHAVAYTHEHADHLYGLDDLRLMQFYLGGPVPIYCEGPVEARIRKSFDYAFHAAEGIHTGGVPKLQLHPINSDPFDLLGMRIVPIRLQHGPRLDILGFRIGNIAYCTDTSAIPAVSIERLQNLDVLILDCLRHQPHVTHLCLDDALALAVQIKAKRTLLTHLSHDLDHEATSKLLPTGVELAYDGMEITLI